MEKKVEKNIDLKKNNVKIVILIVIVIVVAVFLAIKFISFDNEDDLKKSLIEMGREFYEDFYYEQVGAVDDERSVVLSKFVDVGIKIDLDNLERYNDSEFSDKIKEFKNSKTGDECSKMGTRIIIYPKSPYGKKDYKIEALLDCGFDEKR